MLKLNESKLLKGLAKVKNSDDVVEVMKNIEELESWISTEMFSQLDKDHTISEKKIIKEFKKIVKREIKKEDNCQDLTKGIFIDSGFTNYLNGYWLISLADTEIDLKLPKATKTMDVKSLYYSSNVDTHRVGLDNTLIDIEYKKYKNGMIGLRGIERDEYKKEKGNILLTGFNDNNEELKIKLNLDYLYQFSKIFNFEECEIEFKDRVSPLQISDKQGNKGIILPIR
jgi:hypothetical protein